MEIFRYGSNIFNGKEGGQVIMATALKHKQRSHRSYQQNRKVIGSVAVASAQLANSHHYNKMAHNEGNWLDTFKQMFRMVQKGDR